MKNDSVTCTTSAGQPVLAPLIHSKTAAPKNCPRQFEDVDLSFQLIKMARVKSTFLKKVCKTTEKVIFPNVAGSSEAALCGKYKPA